MKELLAIWDDDGGASAHITDAVPLDGTVNQIAWAEQIKVQVNAEFDRIRRLLESVGKKTSAKGRGDIVTIIRILEEKRAEVMAQSSAGYFIHDWQEMRTQVRELITKDPRYTALKVSIN